jgi:general secretion pathway protein K
MVCPTRGSALLMVLWISAALAAVAFSLANTVRGETDRTSTEIDELRGYYLAAGAVDRAAVELLWSVTFGGERKIKQGAAWVDYTFPEGVAHVELIPETAKLDVNFVPPDRLMRLVMALGVEQGQASEITRAIVARRTPRVGSGGGLGGGAGGAFSLAPGSSFPTVGASLQEIEELLSVRGITPELFYGTYVPAPGDPGPDQPRLIRRSGLVECLSVFGSKGPVDANTADPAVLTALGMTPDVVQFLLRLRRVAPLTQERLNQLAPMLGPAAQFLRLEGNSIITMRATARVRLANGQLSDMKRTVAAQVKYMPSGYTPPIHVLRWYDTTWSN